MDNSEGELLSMSLHELGGLKPSTWEHLGVTSSFSGRNVEREAIGDERTREMYV